jgi:hypothetical protein
MRCFGRASGELVPGCNDWPRQKATWPTIVRMVYKKRKNIPSLCRIENDARAIRSWHGLRV